MRFADLPAEDYDAAARQDPVYFLENCRRHSPLLRLVSKTPEKNILLVTAADDVLRVVADADHFSSTGHPQSKRYDSDHDARTACLYAQSGLNLKNIAVWSDGAYHARVRKLIQLAFSSVKIAAKTPFIQAFVDQLLDGCAEIGKLDFVESFSRRLPSMVITREFGLLPQDVELMMNVTNTVSAMVDTLGPKNGTELAAPVIIALQKLLLERLQGGNLPPDCLLLDLAESQIGSEPALTRDELMWLASLLLAAGGHTTGAMIAWSAYMLAARPDIQGRLREQPARIDAFVEEVLRVHGPVPGGYRTAMPDASIREVAIPEGTWLMVRWDGPNFDDSRFSNPRDFDIDRANVRQHTTFGHGKHACIGNLLARREIALTVASMLRRFSRIEFDGDPRRPDLIPSFDVHILARLPLILTGR